MHITLIPITDQNIAMVSTLHVAPSQIGYVETIAESYQEAKEFPFWRPVAIQIDHNLVGFAMYGLWKEEEENGRVWLDRFFLDMHFQGKGYARPVLTALLQTIRNTYNYPEVYLSVYENNTVAIHLYKSFGFSFNGEIDINGEDIMVLHF